MPMKRGYSGGGPNKAGQSTKVYDHRVNGKPVGKKDAKRPKPKKGGY